MINCGFNIFAEWKKVYILMDNIRAKQITKNKSSTRSKIDSYMNICNILYTISKMFWDLMKVPQREMCHSGSTGAANK